MQRKQVILSYPLFFLAGLFLTSQIGLHSNAYAVDPIGDGEVVECVVTAEDFADFPAVQRALQIKEQADQANLADLELLWFEVRQHIEPMDLRGKEEFKQQVIVRLQQDRERLVAVKAALDQMEGEDRGSDELRSSLGKLIGSETASGILDDARSLLEEEDPRHPIFSAAPSSFGWRANEITVAKTLFTYAMLETFSGRNLSDTNSGLLSQLSLFYRTSLPTHLGLEQIQDLCLAFRSDSITDGPCPTEEAWNLCIPNAGYVYGGTIPNYGLGYWGTGRDDRFCGSDCSALIAFTHSTATRLSTMMAEYVAREKTDGFEAFQGEDYSDGRKTELFFQIETKMPIEWGEIVKTEKHARFYFMVDYNFEELLKQFDVINPSSTADLQPGDIMLWRWNRKPDADPGVWGRSGHMAIFLESRGEDSLIAVEANRANDKSFEGVIFRLYDLNREGKDTYVLRRRAD